MADVRPPLSPTSSNVKRPSETAASQTQKKQRLDDEQSSNQERQVIPFQPPQQDARLAAKHASLTLCVSRAVENAADALTEFCDNDADRQAVWCGIGNDAQLMLKRLIAAGRVGGFDRVIVAVGGDDHASAISVTDQEQVVPFQPPQQDARLAAEHALLTLSVSRALENAAWTLDEFCDTDADRPAVWREMSDGAQDVIARLVAAGSINERAIVALEATSEEEEAEPDEDEERAAEGWLSPKGVVDDAVAAAKAAANTQSDGILTKLNAALDECGTEGEPGSLEMIPKKDLTLKAIEEIINIKEVVGASYASLFAKGEKTSKAKAQGRVRPRLQELIKKATENKSVALEKAEVGTRLRLELAAVKALPEDASDVIIKQSLRACASLLAAANPAILCSTRTSDEEPGNVDLLANAMGAAGVTLWYGVDVRDQSLKGLVAAAVDSLDAAIAALPPKEVAEAVLERTKLVKLAPRTNDAACAALITTLKDAARSFAAQDAASAEKTTVNLEDFPIIDDETLERRTAQNVAWSNAPPAQQANVHFGIPYDSHALGTTAPLQQWPEWRGRPTIVAHPQSELDGVALTTPEPWNVLAKKLVHGEKSEKGKPGEEESG